MISGFDEITKMLADKIVDIVAQQSRADQQRNDNLNV
jgi:hypothetical protein